MSRSRSMRAPAGDSNSRSGIGKYVSQQRVDVRGDVGKDGEYFGRAGRWLTRHRRLVRDYERRPEHHEAMVWWATVAIMTRRLARELAAAPPAPRWGQPRPPRPAAA